MFFQQNIFLFTSLSAQFDGWNSKLLFFVTPFYHEIQHLILFIPLVTSASISLQSNPLPQPSIITSSAPFY